VRAFQPILQITHQRSARHSISPLQHALYKFGASTAGAADAYGLTIEGRYGIEDTRMAIREARKQGIRVFGVTVDEEARDYFPYIFGRGAYAIVPNIERLPSALPAIYRQLAG
jgi:hypothetical protein